MGFEYGVYSLDRILSATDSSRRSPYLFMVIRLTELPHLRLAVLDPVSSPTKAAPSLGLVDLLSSYLVASIRRILSECSILNVLERLGRAFERGGGVIV